MTGFRLGMSTYSYVYRMTALEACLHLARFGYREFELVLMPPHIWPPEMSKRQRKEFARRLSDEGLRITSFCYPTLDNNFTSPNKHIRRQTVDDYKAMLDVAAEWDVPLMSLLPGRVLSFFPPPRDWMMKWLVDATAELAPYAHRLGVALAMENVPFTFLPKVRDVLGALDLIGDPKVGMLFDVANAFYAGDDPVKGLRLAADRLALVHLSDTTRTVFRHDPIGKGAVDFPAVAKTLREIGFEGASMFELVITDADKHLAQSNARLARAGWEQLAAPKRRGRRAAR